MSKRYNFMRMPANGLNKILLESRDIFSPVVPFDPGKDKLVALDFTANNQELTGSVIGDITLFCRYIDEQLAGHDARYGIGGYAEHRTIYSRSLLFDPPNPDEEPRRLHLGTDIWGAAGTRVMAPLEGVVHSFAFNDRPGDYGATLILQHELKGVIFYTLYGHLSRSSIEGLEEGNLVGKGQVTGWLGIPAENGHWPPHLHFQLIQDMQEKKGDYPGVCRFSERQQYLANSPDPDLVLQLNCYAGG